MTTLPRPTTRRAQPGRLGARRLQARRLLAAVCLIGCVAPVLTGCRGDRSDAPPRQIIPDMFDQPRWDAQEQTDLYLDGRTMRPRVQGTVAYASLPIDPAAVADAAWARFWLDERDAMLAENDAVYRGTGSGPDSTAGYVKHIPLPVTGELIETGREKYNIYCSACHGYEGNGRGTVGLKWSYLPANLLNAPYLDRNDPKGSDGYLFHVVLNGVYNSPAHIGDNSVLRMPGYAHAVTEHEAWGIVAYVRVLQKASGGTIAEVPDPAARARLEQQARAASLATPPSAPDSPAGSANTTGGGQ